MPTPGQLIVKMSQVLSIPEATLTVFDRTLRDAGLLGKAGRGRGSVQRSPLDTARLLIAVLATNSPARAAEAVVDFGCLYLYSAQGRDPNDMRLSELWDGALDAHSFEQALEGLIAGFGKQSFRDAMTAHLHPTPHDPMTEGFFPNISIELHVTELQVFIGLGGNIYCYKHPTYAPFGKPQIFSNLEADAAAFSEITAPHFAMLDKYRGILTRRTITFSQLRALSEFVCNVSEEDRLE